MMKPSEPKEIRIQYIDALRAVAALSVLFVHIAAYIARQPDAPWLALEFRLLVLEHFDFGLFGVALFFYISGFVVPHSLIKSSGLLEFWIHRLFRLYPLFWFSLVAVILTEGLIHNKSFSIEQIVANGSMAPQLFGVQPISGVYWTLFVELLFYFSCSILYRAGWLRNVYLTAALVIILISATALPMLVNKIYGFGLPEKYIAFHLSFLFSGLLVRLCLYGNSKPRYTLLYTVLLIQFALSVVVTGILSDSPLGFGYFTSHANLFAYAAATLIFLWSVTKEKPISPILLRIGASSYSLYLLHWPLIVVLIAVLPGTVSQQSLLLFFVGSILTLWLAELSYRYIEKPCIHAGKYWGRRFAAFSTPRYN